VAGPPLTGADTVPSRARPPTAYGVEVRDPVTFHDLELLEASATTADAHREAVATLLGWAGERHPDDQAREADLVSSAAWHLDQAGDIDAALELHRRAVTAEGRTTPDARCLLAAALLDAGRADEAKQVAEELRRAHPRVVDIAGMAEVFELFGDLQQANRWVAMGMGRLDLIGEDDPLEDVDVELLLTIRRRVRQALGFPPDPAEQPGR
jgi:Tetratricopeptide repeat